MSMKDDVVWTTEECADFLRVPKSRLDKERITPGAVTPPHIKLGHLVRYRRSDVLDWLSSISARL